MKLTDLIQRSRKVLFFDTENSRKSKECQWELNLALTLNKRVIPVSLGEVDLGKLHPSLATVQGILVSGNNSMPDKVGEIISALDLDQEWEEIHTRLGIRAKTWKEGGEVLNGKDLRSFEAAAEQHQGKLPE